VSGVVQITAGAVGALIGGELGPIGADVIGALAAQTANIVAETFCAADPPPDPNITATDIYNAAQYLNPLVSGPALIRIGQWVQRQLWWQLCDCTTVATPPITIQPLPTVQFTPAPGGTGVTGTPCWTQIYSGTVPAGAADPLFPGEVNVTQQLMPAQWIVPGNTVPGITDPWIIPAEYPTIVQADVQLAVDAVPTREVQFNVNDYIGGWSGEYSLSLGPGTNNPNVSRASVSFGLPPTPWNQAPRRLLVDNADQVPHTFTASWTLWCNTPGPAQPCCPPDLTLQATLDRILGIVQQLLTNPGAGTSLPRLPNYVAKTTHAGISGDGVLQLVDPAIAVRVDVTSDLSSWPHNPGDPNYYWSLGFITPEAHGTPLKGSRLVYDSQIYPLQAQSTGVAYTLEPGVTVTVTELLEG
jgi:hypothetical protein